MNDAEPRQRSASRRKWLIAAIAFAVWIAAMAAFVASPLGANLRESALYRDVTAEVAQSVGQEDGDLLRAMRGFHIPFQLPRGTHSLTVLEKRHPRLPGRPIRAIAHDAQNRRLDAGELSAVEAWIAELRRGQTPND